MDEADRGEAGGIIALLDLVDDHRAAIEYDWRTRFHTPWSEVEGPGGMSWGEAWRLAKMLLADPGSQLSAAHAGWTYPASRELQATWDLFDLTHAVASGKRRPKPFPRPWDAPKVLGAKENRKLSQDQIFAALAARGH